MNIKEYKLPLIVMSLVTALTACEDTSKNPDQALAAPTIVTQDNFPQAFTNMRFGAIVQKTGGVNKFFANRGRAWAGRIESARTTDGSHFP